MTSRRRTSRRLQANAYGDPAVAVKLRRGALEGAIAAAQDATHATFGVYADAAIAADAAPTDVAAADAAAAALVAYEDARELLKDLRKMLADADVKLRSNRRRRTSRRA